MRPLELPDEITKETHQEVFRAWIDGEALSLSVCHNFPESYSEDVVKIWSILLSDICHHVADACALDGQRECSDIRDSITNHFSEVVRSERGTRFGNLETFSTVETQLLDPDVSGDKNCVEIVRILLVPKCINVIVRTGLVSDDAEDAMWGNLIYDMAAMVAESYEPAHGVTAIKLDLIEGVLDRIRNPGTEFSGHFY